MGVLPVDLSVHQLGVHPTSRLCTAAGHHGVGMSGCGQHCSHGGPSMDSTSACHSATSFGSDQAPDGARGCSETSLGQDAAKCAQGHGGRYVNREGRAGGTKPQGGRPSGRQGAPADKARPRRGAGQAVDSYGSLATGNVLGLRTGRDDQTSGAESGRLGGAEHAAAGGVETLPVMAGPTHADGLRCRGAGAACCASTLSRHDDAIGLLP